MYWYLGHNYAATGNSLGGWQGRWLARVAELSLDGKSLGDSMRYLNGHRETVVVYAIGLVVTEFEWIMRVIPNPVQRELFMSGKEEEFYAWQPPDKP